MCSQVLPVQNSIISFLMHVSGGSSRRDAKANPIEASSSCAMSAAAFFQLDPATDFASHAQLVARSDNVFMAAAQGGITPATLTLEPDCNQSTMGMSASRGIVCQLYHLN